MIYFIQSEENQLIKVGYSSHIDQKLNQLRANSPSKLVLLSTTSGDKKSEKRLHNLLNCSLSHADWFLPTDDVLKIVEDSKIKELDYHLMPSRKSKPKKRKESFVLSNWQSQIVHGTLLGNGYLTRTKYSKNYYLTISENIQQQWLLYKGAELENFSARKPLIETESVWKWRSASNSVWNEYRELHYLDRKKIIDISVLNLLQDIGLAIWFGDKGYWHKNGNIALRTSTYTMDENKEICQYFNEVDMSCNVVNISKNRPNIVFDKDGTLNYLKTIAHRLPVFMQHKLSF